MTDLAVPTAMDTQRAALERIADGIRRIDSLDELTEVRARIEAVRAWAKVHKETKALRLALLRVEIEALVRLVRLDGLHVFHHSSNDRRAALYLAAMTDAERAALLADNEDATTAVGMCAGIWQRQRDAEDKIRRYRSGAEYAQKPSPPPPFEEAVKHARDYVVNVTAVLANVVSEFTTVGEPFTVSGMAAEIIDQAGIDGSLSGDREFMRGVKEMCRHALRGPIPRIDGTVIPKVLPVLLEDGTQAQIPTLNATVAHLDYPIAIRREQLAQDNAALARLERFAEMVKAHPGVTPATRIGDVLAASVSEDDDTQAVAS